MNTSNIVSPARTFKTLSSDDLRRCAPSIFAEHARPGVSTTRGYPIALAVERGLKLAESQRRLGAKVDHHVATLRQVAGDSERLPANASLWERVREVAIYEDETGYLGRATRDADGTIWLSEHNCAISGVSSPYPIACQEELELFGEVLGATVTRECHIASGGRSCTYRVEPLEG